MDRELIARTEPTPELLADARRVAAIIRAQPTPRQTRGRHGLTAERIADLWNATGAEFDERIGARHVRRLIWIARRHLGEPIVADSGGGYRIAASVAEALAYAEGSRQMGRDYMALAAAVEDAARRAVGPQMELPGAGDGPARPLQGACAGGTGGEQTIHAGA